jgi:hypothetical protein
MREYLKKLWSDEASFRATVRGVAAMVGAVLPLIPGVPIWIGPVVMAASQFISAGDKNLPVK